MRSGISGDRGSGTSQAAARWESQMKRSVERLRDSFRLRTTPFKLVFFK